MQASKKAFKENLSHYIERKGCSQRELANSIGVHPSMVGFWLNGTNCPRMDKLQKLADYFGVTVSDLVTSAEEIQIKTDAELLMDKIKQLDRQQIEMVKTYIDFLLSQKG